MYLFDDPKEKILKFKIGQRVKLINCKDKKAKKYLKLNKIYFVRSVKDKHDAILLKGYQKEFKMFIFKTEFNKYDWISFK